MKKWFSAHFRRVTSSNNFIPQIDGLRLFAILLVIGHHVVALYLEQTHRLGTQSLPRDWAGIYSKSRVIPWALHLAMGVPLFCAISGFVLTLPFARAHLHREPPPSLKTYLLRRLVRLELPYVLNLLFLFSVIVLPWRQLNPTAYFRSYFGAFAPHLFASLVYLHGAIFGQASWVNGVAWTLEIEIQFYLVLPIFALLFRMRSTALRRGFLMFLIVGSALAAQYWILPGGSDRLKLSLAVQLHFFLAGLLLADIYLDPPRTVRPVHADAIAFLSSVLLIYVVHWKASLGWLQPLLTIGFYFGVLQGNWASRPFRVPLVTLLGGMSYTVFLYHFFIARTLLPFTVQWFPPVHSLWFDAAVQFCVLSLPIFVVSAGLFLAAERPFMVLSKKLSRRSRARDWRIATVPSSGLL